MDIKELHDTIANITDLTESLKKDIMTYLNSLPISQKAKEQIYPIYGDKVDVAAAALGELKELTKEDN